MSSLTPLASSAQPCSYTHEATAAERLRRTHILRGQPKLRAIYGIRSLTAGYDATSVRNSWDRKTPPLCYVAVRRVRLSPRRSIVLLSESPWQIDPEGSLLCAVCHHRQGFEHIWPRRRRFHRRSARDHTGLLPRRPTWITTPLIWAADVERGWRDGDWMVRKLDLSFSGERDVGQEYHTSGESVQRSENVRSGKSEIEGESVGRNGKEERRRRRQR